MTTMTSCPEAGFCPEPGKDVMVCVFLPPKINSGGLLPEVIGHHSPGEFFSYGLPLLELQLILILILVHATSLILKRLGISSFVPQVLAGLILGPTFLGRYEFTRKVLFNHESQDVLNVISHLSFVVYLFLTGIKVDVGIILNQGSRKVLIIGISAVMVPFVIGLGYIRFQLTFLADNKQLRENIAILVLQSMSAFPVIFSLVGELKLLHSEVGRLGLSVTGGSEFINVFLLLGLAFTAETTVEGAARQGLGLAAFFVIVAFLFRPAVNWVIGRTPEGKPVNSSYVYVITALAFGCVTYFHVIHSIQGFGALILGLALPSGPPFGSVFVEKFETFNSGILLQICAAVAMMRADLRLLITEFERIKYYMLFVSFVSAIKFLTSIVSSYYAKLPLVDALVLALIMSSKGMIELMLYAMFRDMKILRPEIFSLLAFCILVNAVLVPLLVKYLCDPSRKFAGHEGRNIMSLKPNSELRVVACIYRPDNVASVIRLLDASYPSKESPICVYVLHLIKLVGRYTPVFIAHQKNKPVSNTCSQNVVLAFNQYERSQWGSVSVHSFTSISLPKLMYEDICTLALDRLASLILIPFHRKWSIDGSIESEDHSLRTTNRMVLEKAPCTVGIFFERGKMGRRNASTRSSVVALSICMIFFGGKDDREALTLAKRMTTDPSTRLTVVRFVAGDDENDDNDDAEERLLDAQELQDVKKSSVKDKNVDYVVRQVRDGPETALLVRSLGDEHDLFVVGRRYEVNYQCRQTTGLSEWSEFPELGIVGDLLASKDLTTKASVLVVNKQEQMQ